MIGTRLAAQQEGSAGPTAKVKATTVLVDVVVRDKKGRPIHGLKASDFKVFEDGVEQDIGHFEEIGGDGPGAEQVPEASPAGSTTAAPEGEFTAMVFDRLSPNSRNFALKAAQAYISEAPFPESKIGIFFADLSPRTLQFYTSQQETLKSVVDQALGGTSTRQGSVSADSASGTAGSRPATDSGDLTAPAAPGGTGAAATGIVQGQTAVDAGTQGMSERMSSMAGRLQQDEQGYASTNTLLAIISSLEPLPGRKSILYFSEGVSVTPAVEKRFRSVISAANRANVSIYTIDAAGLRVQSSGITSASQINSAASRGGANSSSTSLNQGGSLLQEGLEKNETAIKSDVHGGLNRLAAETGGLLIRETNKLEDGMEEIAQDLSDYYLLGYTPKNSEMDGSFREIEVKVDAKDARPRFRKGYLAIDRSITEPMLDYEAPVVALMNKADASGSLSLRSAALSFPIQSDPGLVALMAQVPPGTMTYQEKEDKTGAVSDFRLVALCRNSSGDVVRKVSQRYQILRQTGDTPRDGILYYKQIRLDPGEYSVQIAGYDALAEKVGFSRSEVRVPGEATTPRLSSVIIVRAAETLSGQNSGGAGPLQYQGVQLYPNLGEPMSKAQYPQITFYFTAFPGTESLDSATVDLLSGDKTLHSFRVPLPAPDAQGQIQFASAIPSQSIPVGDYGLKVTVGSGDQAASRTCRFKLAE